MKSNLIYTICLAGILVIGCKTGKQTISNTSVITNNSDTTENVIEAAEKTDYKRWRDTENGIDAFGFIHFPNETCKRYENLFEQMNPAGENDISNSKSLYCGSLDHYYALTDLQSLLNPDNESRLVRNLIDSLIRWRIAMFYPFEEGNRTYFNSYCSFHKRIDSLLNYEPICTADIYNWLALKLELEKVYVGEVKNNLLTNTYFKGKKLAHLVENEDKAFNNYVKAVDFTGNKLILESDVCGSALVIGCYTYLIETYKLRALSLQYVVCNFNSDSTIHTIPNEYSLRDIKGVHPQNVLNEYDRFIRTIRVDTLYSPVLSTLEQRKDALRKEKRAWKNWIDARRVLSNELKTLFPDSTLYPNLYSLWESSTNNILWRKWIQLNNQLVDMGLYSNEELFLNDDCSINDLKKNCYAERWDSYLKSFEMPSTAQLSDQDENIGVYINKEGVINDNEQMSVWIHDKKTDEKYRLMLSHPGSTFIWYKNENGPSKCPKDSIYTIYRALIIPNTDSRKILVEGIPDRRNVWSYILTIGDREAILLPSNAGLIGFAQEEGLLVMESYDYYQQGGRFSRVEAYNPDGYRIASMKANLQKDMPLN